MLRRDLEAARGTIESAPRVIKPLDVLHATVTGFQTARMRRAAIAAGLHPDHDLLAKAESARQQAAAVADALRVENVELRAERDNLRARCDDLGAGPVQAVSGALADAELRLTHAHAELAEARRDAERLTALLSRKRELVRVLQKTQDAQEIELAAANAEVVSRKSEASGLLSVAIAREQAMQAVRGAQATRPPAVRAREQDSRHSAGHPSRSDRCRPAWAGDAPARR